MVTSPSPAAGPRTVAAHHDAVLALGSPLPAVTVTLADAVGAALADDVVSPIALPSFDNSAMDGYALRAADLGVVPVTLPVSADIPAGQLDVAPLEPGSAARIMTGAPLPAGADTVVQVEWTDGGLTTVRLHRVPDRGANIRRAGEDTPAGVVVLRAGTEVTPAAVGLLAALGLAEVRVHRRPVVGVLATGSELVAPGRPLAVGEIYDSNAALLAAVLTAAGARVVVLDRVPDDPPRAAAVLDAALATLDLLVTSGGISAGAYEVVKDVLAPRGVTFVRVAMQPGGPQGLGTVADPNGRAVPVVTLPGNPVSTFVSAEIFVRPLVRRLLGHRVVDRPAHRAALTDPLTRRDGRTQLRRGRHLPDTATVRLVGGAGSHLLAALADSDCLVEIPPGEGTLAAGTVVTVYPTG